jgi:hypothetical protein
VGRRHRSLAASFGRPSAKGTFEETKHPRRSDGKFGSGSVVPKPHSIDDLNAGGLDGDTTWLLGNCQDQREELSTLLEDEEWASHLDGVMPGLKAQTKGSVRIALASGTVAALLADGRFKSAHESSSPNAGGGKENYLSSRSFYETQVMGLGEDDPKPLYGYVGPVDDGDGSISDFGYGYVSAVLNDDVRSRSSVTFGDSINGLLEPIALDNVDDASPEQVLRARQNQDDLLGTNGYWPDNLPTDDDGNDRLVNYGYNEVQVHGGLSVDDVEAWEVTRSPITRDAAARGGWWQEELVRLDAAISQLQEAGHRVIVQ